MTAEGLDKFNYEPASSHETEADRRHYWAVAIGLQQVDGLEVSDYLRDLSDGHVKGKYSLEETAELLKEYHAAGNDRDTAEADLVSQRIAELLSRRFFELSPEYFKKLHGYLFQDLDPDTYHPGEFKTERMVKQEEILNGDSVLYADPLAYDMALRGYFSGEQAADYHCLEHDDLAKFCHGIAYLWQIHPFAEGNTRTVAVFSELYLNQLGFDVSNEPFESNARYFRDALVRAMYRNAAAGVFPDESFLVAFYENALGPADNTLDREALICTALFENPSLLRNVNPSKALTQPTA